MTEGTTYHFCVDSGAAGTRLDLLLPRLLPDVSRSRGQQLIGAGLATVNGEAAVKNYTVRGGDRLDVTIPPPVPAVPLPEEIPLEILHDDKDVVVVNKPAGMVVHPAPGHPGGTLVNALLAAVPTLSGIGGEVRPGIVHRLDKGTSGVVVVAKNDRAHRALSAQFAGRTVVKTYLALAWGTFSENEGRYDTPIGRDTKERQKISARTRRPRAAVTNWRVLRRLTDSTLLELHPETGRTHQIRVHLAGARHPVLGDAIYAPRGSSASAYRRASVRHGFRDRLALHAWKLRFTPPSRRTPLEVVAPLPPELARLIGNESAPARESRRGDAKRGTPSERTEGSTRGECQRGCSGTRSDRGPNETMSSRRVAAQMARRRMVESEGVRSGRTPQAERERVTKAR